MLRKMMKLLNLLISICAKKDLWSTSYSLDNQIRCSNHVCSVIIVSLFYLCTSFRCIKSVIKIWIQRIKLYVYPFVAW